MELSTAELRTLANSHTCTPAQQHALDVELLHREQEEALCAFALSMAEATAEVVHEAERVWCCRRGQFAEAHRFILGLAENRLTMDRLIEHDDAAKDAQVRWLKGHTLGAAGVNGPCVEVFLDRRPDLDGAPTCP